MKKRIVSNFGLKIMAVLVSFLIWLMVINGDDPVKTEAFRGVPITVKNADVFMEKVKKVYKPREDKETGQEIDTVTVYVKARRSVLERLSSGSFTVTADFENIVEDLNSIPLDVSCTDVPGLSMKDMWCDLRSLKVDLENVKEATYVVSAKEEGTPGTGYQVGKIELIDGESVAIAGPESDMKKIGKVMVSVDVQGLRKNKRSTETIKIIDKNEEAFTASQMERLTIKTLNGKVFTEDKMDVRIEIWKVKQGVKPSFEVTGTPADGYRVVEVTTAPETIELAGNKEALAELGSSLSVKDQISVEGASETFSQEINIKEYLEDHYDDSLQLARNLSDLVVVTVKMEKIGTKTVQIPVSDIVIKGKPEDMNYKLTPADNLSLEIQPKMEETTGIRAEDIMVTLDLSSEEYQKPGNYQVPLAVVLPEGYRLTSQATIAVNLMKIEQITEKSSGQADVE